MRAEDFFPLGWLEKPFRRQPYPDMTYQKALDTAQILLWNMGTEEASELGKELGAVSLRMNSDHVEFDGRSGQNVAEFGVLWRGKVTTLLKWFQTSGGTA